MPSRTATETRSLHRRRSGPVYVEPRIDEYEHQESSPDLPSFKERIIPIQRGLYATVPVGNDRDSHPVDPFLIAVKMAEELVLAYHTAFEFHGKAYSMYSRLVYTSESRSKTTRFRSHEYTRVSVPHAIEKADQAMIGVETHERAGVVVYVTNLERTFADVLDRPELSGSWEEIWRSLESIEFFDMDQVDRYAGLLGNKKTAAKVGFFLDQHRESLPADS